MTDAPYLSVVIPCYNEAENLRRGVLSEVNSFLRKQDFSWEVIISDDGSTDDSLKIIRKFQKSKSKLQTNSNYQNIRVLENKHGGKPYAVWQGIKGARGKIILFTDMDQSTPLNQVKKLLPYFDQDYDVVIGSRGIKRKGFPLYRQLGSFIFFNFRRLFILSNIKDTQCGFKAFKVNVARELFPKMSVLKNWQEATGWKVTAFDVELLYLAQKADYKIKEVLVNWHDEDIAKGKNRNFIKESRQMLEQIINVKKNDWQGKYEENPMKEN